MSDPGIFKELAEISNRQITLSESLLGYKSRRDRALIRRTQKDLRDLSRRRAVLLRKIRKGKDHADLSAPIR
jgi:hypothetical protein